MSIFFKGFTGTLIVLLLSGFLLSDLTSCQKADPTPYSVPSTGSLHTVTTPIVIKKDSITKDTTKPAPPDTTPSFKAAVGNSSVMTFTPTKIISGSNTTLKGTYSYYTITLTFPGSTGPGNYDIGFPSSNITATLVNGSTTYVDNYNWGAGGTLTIDSISSKGKYYGKFNFTPMDSVSLNTVNVKQGLFYHI